jgi:predicted dehydrogenase
MKAAPASTTRRTFLKKTAVAGAALSFPAVLRATDPNGRVQVAVVGVDGRGHANISSLSDHSKMKFVGFCDIDSTAFGRADKIAPGTPHFADFRVMLEKLGDKVDAVVVATPDHMHALVGISAMQRGKHVYCEKPLAHTVWECRQMRLWAQKKNVVTQMGNQGHSSVEYRLATRLIREGVIGKVKEVHSWSQLTGNDRTRLLEPPAPGAVPKEVNWDLWLGSAPTRQYSPGVYHPFAWRDWQDFGGGAALGDFGCHILDPVFTSLGLKAPISVAAENSGINRWVWPTMQTIRYVFPGNEFIAGNTLNVTWSDGGIRPDKKLAKLPPEIELPKTGSLFIGEKGNMVLPHPGGPRFYPVEDFKSFVYPKDIPGQNHWHNWIDAIIAGKKSNNDFDSAALLAETVQLGNVATRAIRPPTPKRGNNAPDPSKAFALKWDSENFRFTNSDEANKLLTKTYRPGWEVPAASSTVARL